MLQNIQSVIFDLDGTLVDSMWVWGDIDDEYMGKFGKDVPLELNSEIAGMSFSETAHYFKEKFSLSHTVEEIKEQWLSMAYDKYEKEVPLKNGVKEFLTFLKEQNISVGIASSNAAGLVEAVLKSHGIRDYFDSVHTSCEVAKGKPSPDIYLLVAEDLKQKPEQCLVFEDIPEGIMAGKKAGMHVCAVEDRFSKEQILEKRKLADYYIQNYFDIFKKTYEVLN